MHVPPFKKRECMLKIIRPEDYIFYEDRIETLLNLLSVGQHFDLPIEKHSKSHFIIAENEEKDVYGGAVIYPQKIPFPLELIETDTHEERAIKLTSAFQVKGDDYWRARICLCLELGRSVAAILETQDMCHRFYKALYLAFKQFGEEQSTDYLAYTLWLPETYSMKTYEYWPYRLDVTIEDPDHDFNHGLLSLKGKAFKARHNKTGRPS